MPEILPGTIILLNGASSSGKTSILKSIQNTFEEPYIDAGIDKFIWMMPKRYLDRPLWDDVLGLAVEAGESGRILFKGMHHAIAALANNGLNVAADHVLVEKNWWVECASLFHNLPAYLVQVYCPLDVLELREKQRTDRTLGQARAQFSLVHRYDACDLQIDTSLLSVEECTAAIYQMVESQKSPQAFRTLHERFSSNGF